MARNIHGGGANTNVNGLRFEQETNLNEALEKAGYVLFGNNVMLKNTEIIATSAGKNKLYNDILEPRGIDYKKYISRKLLPDEALLNYLNNTIYIIEKKFQHSDGSVDEKLQTCDFKRKQYKKLFNPIKINVEYIYVLSDFFEQPRYVDVFNYIHSSGCEYFFNEIPIDYLELPR